MQFFQCFVFRKHLRTATDHIKINTVLIYVSYGLNFRSRGSSVSIVSGYGMDDRAIAVRSPAEARDFSFSLCIQTGSGAHPASCKICTEGKARLGREPDRSPHLVARSLMSRSCTSSLSCATIGLWWDYFYGLNFASVATAYMTCYRAEVSRDTKPSACGRLAFCSWNILLSLVYTSVSPFVFKRSYRSKTLRRHHHLLI
jgi:hypothetical protein